MQIQRLFQIVYLLLNKKTTTARELAAEFGVSVRTIYRDIDTLSAAGIPVYARQGKGGGISLMEHYVLSKSTLTETEQKEILFALQSLQATQPSEDQQLLTKLSHLFMQPTDNWLEVDFSPWGQQSQSKNDFQLLKEAILTQRVVTFTYFSSSGISQQRQVEPLRLVFKVHSWYLEGYCLTKQAMRLFKITRMTAIALTADSFVSRSVPTSLTMAPPQPQEELDLTLHFSEKAAYRVFDEFPATSIHHQADGSFLVETQLPASDWLVSYLLSFGTSLEVVAPKAMKERLRREVQGMLEKYVD